MEICEKDSSEINGEEIGSFGITTQIDQELLHGEGKSGLHPLIKQEVNKRLKNRLPDITHAVFHIDGLEKGSRPIIRLHVAALQAF